ncbi:MAG: OmpA family protein [Pseudomonadota bacterium]
MIKKVLTTCALVVALPTLAMAQAQYSATDIEKHFVAPQEEAAAQDCPAGSICLPKKKSRGVCIGSASKCGKQQPSVRQDAGGFDLLITFELGSDRLSKQAEQNLREFAKAMTRDSLKHINFNVDGHTDASGSDSFNMTLSQRRAASVVSFLEAAGIERARLEARGHGETAPRDSDPFAAINRRVEATVRVQ